MSIVTLDDVIRDSLRTFYDDIVKEPWHRRERELVSLYAFGHLLAFCEVGSVLKDRTQIGIEVAVPQHVTSRRRDPDVCKDIVIWAAPRMSCWGINGADRHYPLAVMEWKSLNRIDKTTAGQRKLVEYDKDLAWLQEASRRSHDFTGYGVLVIQNASIPTLQCARVFAGDANKTWLVIPESKH